MKRSRCLVSVVSVFFVLMHPVVAEVVDPRDLLEMTIDTLRSNVIRDQMQIT